jgi:hypothetical protein
MIWGLMISMWRDLGSQYYLQVPQIVDRRTESRLRLQIGATSRIQCKLVLLTSNCWIFTYPIRPSEEFRPLGFTPFSRELDRCFDFAAYDLVWTW